jgi:signal transduction histidine kinase
MESFLDEYQLLRVALGIIGLVYVGVVMVAGMWNTRLNPIVAVILVVTGHALWCRWKGIRSPRVMLLLDLTLWGWVMSLPANQPAGTAVFAFLALLTTLFAQGYWIVSYLLYIAAWYGYAFFTEHPIDGDTIGEFASVVITIGCLALVVYYVRRRLGRLDANRSQMMGTVSHELRNNLTGMIGITDLVDSTEDLSPEEIRELIGLANQQAVDAAEIVEDLLTVSRLESSALEVGIEAVDVDLEVTTVVRRFAGEGTDVSCEVASDVPLVRGDALRVRQVLRNLISNAVRYGGSRIEVTARTTDDLVEIIVGDNGDGVPKTDESTIFLPYRRSTLTRRHASSVGLGLWICRQLANAMGGELEYRRSHGITEFVLRLRVDEPEATTAPTAAKVRRAPAVVDDDLMVSAVAVS